jgi:RimJ/RimL family protein N-acetyltransferase
MSYLSKTMEYYSQWTDISIDKIKSRHFISVLSDKRNEIPKGYRDKFDLYYFINDKVRVASYNKSVEKYINALSKINDVESVQQFIEKEIKGNIYHSIKFVFDKIDNTIDTEDAVLLSKNDFELFSDFFCTDNDYHEDLSWLEKYYNKAVINNSFWCIKEGGKIISTTDSPTVSYMENEIVEIGISTLEKYRNKGNAKKVCTACLKQIIKDGKIPIWSCGNTNIKSIRLAKKIGFKYLADVIMVSI